jgi:hypothetical protein
LSLNIYVLAPLCSDAPCAASTASIPLSQSNYMTSLTAQHQLHHPPVDAAQLLDQGKRPCTCEPFLPKEQILFVVKIISLH